MDNKSSYSINKSVFTVTIFLLMSLFLVLPLQAEEDYHSKGTKTIGLDLAVEHYLEWSGDKYEISAISLENITRSHGLRVASVYQYAGETNLNSIPQDLFSFDLADAEDMSFDDQAVLIKKFLETIDLNNIKILLSSSGYLEQEWAKELVDGLIKRKVFISNSAGNFGLNAPSYSFAENSPYVFVAGSVNSDGLYSHYASEGPGVTIAIPDGSGGVLLPNGDEIGQAFTSGSQPILAKTLYLLLSVLGPNIQPELIKEILKVTAIKTINAFDPLKNQGFGTLNSYMAVRLATAMADLGCKSDCDVRRIYKKLLVSHNEKDIRVLSLLGYKQNLSTLKDDVHVDILNPKTLGRGQTSISCTHPIDCKEVAHYRYHIRYLSTQNVYYKLFDLVRVINSNEAVECSNDYGNGHFYFTEMLLLVSELRERGVSTGKLILDIYQRLQRCNIDAFVKFNYYLSKDRELADSLVKLVTPKISPSDKIRNLTRTYFNSIIRLGVRYAPLEKIIIDRFKDIQRGSVFNDFLQPYYCELKFTHEQIEFLKQLGGVKCDFNRGH